MTSLIIDKNDYGLLFVCLTNPVLLGVSGTIARKTNYGDAFIFIKYSTVLQSFGGIFLTILRVVATFIIFLENLYRSLV